VTANESLIHTSAYAYADVSLNERWTATVGMAADSVKSSVTDSEQLSPKLGLMFEPNSDTTIRATAFRTLEGPLVSKHNIQPRLEPTHVVGFNQFYFGSEGEETTRLGLAIDRKISAIVFAGAELSARSAQSTFQDPQLGPGGLQRIERDESLLTGYLYWTPTTHLAVAVEYQYENVDGNGKVLDDQVTNLKTHRIPVSLNIFNGIGLHARAEATYVDQEGNFSPVATFPEPTIVPGSDSFWVLDLSLSYRLPRRRGSISLSIDNALDQTFRFQDTDPENQSIMPERMLALRFTLSY
jgi:outer membrane receptor protein involved in Fe transport